MEAENIVATTLTTMAAGGIRDHVGGGFHRYAYDEQWQVPSFEKTLYDQAFLGEMYAQLFATTQNPLYKAVALETFAYMTGRLGHSEGGFYGSEDAMSLPDPDAEEPLSGAFYCWPKADFDAALKSDSEAHRLLKTLFSIRARGNAPPGAANAGMLSGKNVLFHALPLEQAATKADIPPANATAIYKRGLAHLRKHRAMRPRPMVDQKILVSWNGYAIAALARGSVDLEAPELLESARMGAHFLFTRMIDKRSGKISRSWLNGGAGIAGVCDDYAAMVDACLALHSTTSETLWLDRAQVIQQRQMLDFLDASTGSFFDASRERIDLFLRLRPEFDSDLLSPNALSARNLVRLSNIAPEPQASQWKAAAEKLFAHFETTMVTQSGMTPGLLAAWEEFTRP